MLANLGVLIGQGLVIGGGQAFTPQTLIGLASNGRFGTYWTLRVVVVILALLIAIYVFFTKKAKKRPGIINAALPWVNLILALALLIAVTLSGHAAAATNNILIYAVLLDWLHLLAASLWVGGMI